jgi:hypothetical protein
MFQISEVQESPSFNGRLSFLTLRDYEDTNDAERLCVDPAMRRIVAKAIRFQTRLNPSGSASERLGALRKRDSTANCETYVAVRPSQIACILP